jgi:flagellar hook protein FlgE
MSIWGAFTDSVQAMNAQAHSLGVISQNIANVNTTGYKKSDDQFKTMLSEVNSTTNIFGVKAAPRQLIDVQGVIAPSTNWSDMSISGKGFFMVNTAQDGSGSMTFTRDGAFGQKVASDPSVVPSPVTPFDPTVSPGSAQKSYLTDSAGNYIMGWMATNGVVNPTNSTKGLTAIGYELGQPVAGTATSTVALQGTVPSNPGVDSQGNPLVQSTGIPVYDNKSAVQTLNLNFTPTSADNWNVGFTMDPNVGTVTSATTAATFDGSGKMLTPAAPVVANVTWKDGTTSSISVDVSKLNQLASSKFQIDHTTQDGSAAGTLSSVNFDDKGQLTGTYTNGKTQLIAQLSLATFVAPNSLGEASGNQFTQTEAAGAMTVSTATQLGGQTALTPNTTELSNVNLEDEFTKMITTQRAYSSASKVFQTADEMTTAVRDLMR